MKDPIEVPAWVAARWPGAFFVEADPAMSRRFPAGSLVLVDPATQPQNGDAALFEVEGAQVLRVLLRGSSTAILAADAADGDWPDIVSREGQPPIKTLGKAVWFMADKTC